ncbi:hypothetical protein PCE1_002141 [Barthelona sp. PCE]
MLIDVENWPSAEYIQEIQQWSHQQLAQALGTFFEGFNNSRDTLEGFEQNFALVLFCAAQIPESRISFMISCLDMFITAKRTLCDRIAHEKDHTFVISSSNSKKEMLSSYLPAQFSNLSFEVCAELFDFIVFCDFTPHFIVNRKFKAFSRKAEEHFEFCQFAFNYANFCVKSSDKIFQTEISFKTRHIDVENDYIKTPLIAVDKNKCITIFKESCEGRAAVFSMPYWLSDCRKSDCIVYPFPFLLPASDVDNHENNWDKQFIVGFPYNEDLHVAFEDQVTELESSSTSFLSLLQEGTVDHDAGKALAVAQLDTVDKRNEFILRSFNRLCVPPVRFQRVMQFMSGDNVKYTRGWGVPRYYRGLFTSEKPKGYSIDLESQIAHIECTEVELADTCIHLACLLMIVGFPTQDILVSCTSDQEALVRDLLTQRCSRFNVDECTVSVGSFNYTGSTAKVVLSINPTDTHCQDE